MAGNHIISFLPPEYSLMRLGILSTSASELFLWPTARVCEEFDYVMALEGRARPFPQRGEEDVGAPQKEPNNMNTGVDEKKRNNEEKKNEEDEQESDESQSEPPNRIYGQRGRSKRTARGEAPHPNVGVSPEARDSALFGRSRAKLHRNDLTQEDNKGGCSSTKRSSAYVASAADDIPNPLYHVHPPVQLPYWVHLNSSLRDPSQTSQHYLDVTVRAVAHQLSLRQGGSFLRREGEQGTAQQAHSIFSKNNLSSTAPTHEGSIPSSSGGVSPSNSRSSLPPPGHYSLGGREPAVGGRRPDRSSSSINSSPIRGNHHIGPEPTAGLMGLSKGSSLSIFHMRSILLRFWLEHAPTVLHLTELLEEKSDKGASAVSVEVEEGERCSSTSDKKQDMKNKKVKASATSSPRLPSRLEESTGEKMPVNEEEEKEEQRQAAEGIHDTSSKQKSDSEVSPHICFPPDFSFQRERTATSTKVSSQLLDTFAKREGQTLFPYTPLLSSCTPAESLNQGNPLQHLSGTMSASSPPKTEKVLPSGKTSSSREEECKRVLSLPSLRGEPDSRRRWFPLPITSAKNLMQVLLQESERMLAEENGCETFQQERGGSPPLGRDEKGEMCTVFSSSPLLQDEREKSDVHFTGECSTSEVEKKNMRGSSLTSGDKGGEEVDGKENAGEGKENGGENLEEKENKGKVCWMMRRKNPLTLRIRLAIASFVYYRWEHLLDEEKQRQKRRERHLQGIHDPASPLLPSLSENHHPLQNGENNMCASSSSSSASPSKTDDRLTQGEAHIPQTTRKMACVQHPHHEKQRRPLHPSSTASFPSVASDHHSMSGMRSSGVGKGRTNHNNGSKNAEVCGMSTRKRKGNAASCINTPPPTAVTPVPLSTSLESKGIPSSMSIDEQLFEAAVCLTQWGAVPLSEASLVYLLECIADMLQIHPIHGIDVLEEEKAKGKSTCEDSKKYNMGKPSNTMMDKSKDVEEVKAEEGNQLPYEKEVNAQGRQRGGALQILKDVFLSNHGTLEDDVCLGLLPSFLTAKTSFLPPPSSFNSSSAVSDPASSLNESSLSSSSMDEAWLRAAQCTLRRRWWRAALWPCLHLIPHIHWTFLPSLHRLSALLMALQYAHEREDEMDEEEEEDGETIEGAAVGARAGEEIKQTKPLSTLLSLPSHLPPSCSTAPNITAHSGPRHPSSLAVPSPISPPVNEKKLGGYKIVRKEESEGKNVGGKGEETRVKIHSGITMIMYTQYYQLQARAVGKRSRNTYPHLEDEEEKVSGRGTRKRGKCSKGKLPHRVGAPLALSEEEEALNEIPFPEVDEEGVEMEEEEGEGHEEVDEEAEREEMGSEMERVHRSLTDFPSEFLQFWESVDNNRNEGNSTGNAFSPLVLPRADVPQQRRPRDGGEGQEGLGSSLPPDQGSVSLLGLNSNRLFTPTRTPLPHHHHHHHQQSPSGTALHQSHRLARQADSEPLFFRPFSEVPSTVNYLPSLTEQRGFPTVEDRTSAEERSRQMQRRTKGREKDIRVAREVFPGHPLQRYVPHQTIVDCLSLSSFSFSCGCSVFNPHYPHNSINSNSADNDACCQRDAPGRNEVYHNMKGEVHSATRKVGTPGVKVVVHHAEKTVPFRILVIQHRCHHQQPSLPPVSCCSTRENIAKRKGNPWDENGEKEEKEPPSIQVCDATLNGAAGETKECTSKMASSSHTREEYSSTSFNPSGIPAAKKGKMKSKQAIGIIDTPPSIPGRTTITTSPLSSSSPKTTPRSTTNLTTCGKSNRNNNSHKGSLTLNKPSSATNSTTTATIGTSSSLPRSSPQGRQLKRNSNQCKKAASPPSREKCKTSRGVRREAQKQGMFEEWDGRELTTPPLSPRVISKPGSLQCNTPRTVKDSIVVMVGSGHSSPSFNSSPLRKNTLLLDAEIEVTTSRVLDTRWWAEVRHALIAASVRVAAELKEQIFVLQEEVLPFTDLLLGECSPSSLPSPSSLVLHMDAPNSDPLDDTIVPFSANTSGKSTLIVSLKSNSAPPLEQMIPTSFFSSLSPPKKLISTPEENKTGELQKIEKKDKKVEEVHLGKIRKNKLAEPILTIPTPQQWRSYIKSVVSNHDIQKAVRCPLSLAHVVRAVLLLIAHLREPQQLLDIPPNSVYDEHTDVTGRGATGVELIWGSPKWKDILNRVSIGVANLRGAVKTSSFPSPFPPHPCATHSNTSSHPIRLSSFTSSFPTSAHRTGGTTRGEEGDHRMGQQYSTSSISTTPTLSCPAFESATGFSSPSIPSRCVGSTVMTGSTSTTPGERDPPPPPSHFLPSSHDFFLYGTRTTRSNHSSENSSPKAMPSPGVSSLTAIPSLMAPISGDIGGSYSSPFSSFSFCSLTVGDDPIAVAEFLMICVDPSGFSELPTPRLVSTVLQLFSQPHISIAMLQGVLESRQMLIHSTFLFLKLLSRAVGTLMKEEKEKRNLLERVGVKIQETALPLKDVDSSARRSADGNNGVSSNRSPVNRDNIGCAGGSDYNTYYPSGGEFNRSHGYSTESTIGFDTASYLAIISKIFAVDFLCVPQCYFFGQGWGIHGAGYSRVNAVGAAPTAPSSTSGSPGATTGVVSPSQAQFRTEISSIGAAPVSNSNASRWDHSIMNTLFPNRCAVHTIFLSNVLEGCEPGTIQKLRQALNHVIEELFSSLRDLLFLAHQKAFSPSSTPSSLPLSCSPEKSAPPSISLGTILQSCENRVLVPNAISSSSMLSHPHPRSLENLLFEEWGFGAFALLALSVLSYVALLNDESQHLSLSLLSISQALLPFNVYGPHDIHLTNEIALLEMEKGNAEREGMTQEQKISLEFKNSKAEVSRNENTEEDKLHLREQTTLIDYSFPMDAEKNNDLPFFTLAKTYAMDSPSVSSLEKGGNECHDSTKSRRSKMKSSSSTFTYSLSSSSVSSLESGSADEHDGAKGELHDTATFSSQHQNEAFCANTLKAFRAVELTRQLPKHLFHYPSLILHGLKALSPSLFVGEMVSVSLKKKNIGIGTAVTGYSSHPIFLPSDMNLCCPISITVFRVQEWKRFRFGLVTTPPQVDGSGNVHVNWGGTLGSQYFRNDCIYQGRGEKGESGVCCVEFPPLQQQDVLALEFSSSFSKDGDRIGEALGWCARWHLNGIEVAVIPIPADRSLWIAMQYITFSEGDMIFSPFDYIDLERSLCSSENQYHTGLLTAENDFLKFSHVPLSTSSFLFFCSLRFLPHLQSVHYANSSFGKPNLASQGSLPEENLNDFPHGEPTPYTSALSSSTSAYPSFLSYYCSSVLPSLEYPCAIPPSIIPSSASLHRIQGFFMLSLNQAFRSVRSIGVARITTSGVTNSNERSQYSMSTSTTMMNTAISRSSPVGLLVPSKLQSPAPPGKALLSPVSFSKSTACAGGRSRSVHSPSPRSSCTSSCSSGHPMSYYRGRKSASSGPQIIREESYDSNTLVGFLFSSIPLHYLLSIRDEIRKVEELGKYPQYKQGKEKMRKGESNLDKGSCLSASHFLRPLYSFEVSKEQTTAIQFLWNTTIAEYAMLFAMTMEHRMLNSVEEVFEALTYFLTQHKKVVMKEVQTIILSVLSTIIRHHFGALRCNSALLRKLWKFCHSEGFPSEKLLQRRTRKKPSTPSPEGEVVQEMGVPPSSTNPTRFVFGTAGLSTSLEINCSGTSVESHQIQENKNDSSSAHLAFATEGITLLPQPLYNHKHGTSNGSKGKKSEGSAKNYTKVADEDVVVEFSVQFLFQEEELDNSELVFNQVGVSLTPPPPQRTVLTRPQPLHCSSSLSFLSSFGDVCHRLRSPQPLSPSPRAFTHPSGVSDFSESASPLPGVTGEGGEGKTVCDEVSTTHSASLPFTPCQTPFTLLLYPSDSLHCPRPSPTEPSIIASTSRTSTVLTIPAATPDRPAAATPTPSMTSGSVNSDALCNQRRGRGHGGKGNVGDESRNKAGINSKVCAFSLMGIRARVNLWFVILSSQLSPLFHIREDQRHSSISSTTEMMHGESRRSERSFDPFQPLRSLGVGRGIGRGSVSSGEGVQRGRGGGRRNARGGAVEASAKGNRKKLLEQYLNGVETLSKCHTIARYEDNWVSPENGIVFDSGDVVTVRVHRVHRTVSFFRNGLMLGSLFVIPEACEKVYPYVGIASSNTRVHFVSSPCDEHQLLSRNLMRMALQCWPSSLLPELKHLIRGKGCHTGDPAGLKLLGSDGDERNVVLQSIPKTGNKKENSLRDHFVSSHSSLRSLPPSGNSLLKWLSLTNGQNFHLIRFDSPSTVVVKEIEMGGRVLKLFPLKLSPNHTTSGSFSSVVAVHVVLPDIFETLLGLLVPGVPPFARSSPFGGRISESAFVSEHLENVSTTTVSQENDPCCSFGYDASGNSASKTNIHNNNYYNRVCSGGSTGNKEGDWIRLRHCHIILRLLRLLAEASPLVLLETSKSSLVQLLPLLIRIVQYMPPEVGSMKMDENFQMAFADQDREVCIQSEIALSSSSHSFLTPLARVLAEDLLFPFETLIQKGERRSLNEELEAHESSPISPLCASSSGISEEGNGEPLTATTDATTPFPSPALKTSSVPETGTFIQAKKEEKEKVQQQEDEKQPINAEREVKQTATLSDDSSSFHLDHPFPFPLLLCPRCCKPWCECSDIHHYPPLTRCHEIHQLLQCFGVDSPYKGILGTWENGKKKFVSLSVNEEKQKELQNLPQSLLLSAFQGEKEDVDVRDVPVGCKVSCTDFIQGKGACIQGRFVIDGRLDSPISFSGSITFDTIPSPNEQGESTEPIAFHQEWSCDACTFLNEGGTTRCSMCYTERRGAVWLCSTCLNSFNSITTNTCSRCGTFRNDEVTRRKKQEKFCFCTECGAKKEYTKFLALRLYNTCPSCCKETEWLPVVQYRGTVSGILSFSGEVLNVSYIVDGEPYNMRSLKSSDFSYSSLKSLVNDEKLLKKMKKSTSAVWELWLPVKKMRMKKENASSISCSSWNSLKMYVPYLFINGVTTSSPLFSDIITANGQAQQSSLGSEFYFSSTESGEESSAIFPVFNTSFVSFSNSNPYDRQLSLLDGRAVDLGSPPLRDSITQPSSPQSPIHENEVFRFGFLQKTEDPVKMLGNIRNILFGIFFYANYLILQYAPIVMPKVFTDPGLLMRLRVFDKNWICFLAALGEREASAVLSICLRLLSMGTRDYLCHISLENITFISQELICRYDSLQPLQSYLLYYLTCFSVNKKTQHTAQQCMIHIFESCMKQQLLVPSPVKPTTTNLLPFNAGCLAVPSLSPQHPTKETQQLAVFALLQGISKLGGVEKRNSFVWATSCLIRIIQKMELGEALPRLVEYPGGVNNAFTHPISLDSTEMIFGEDLVQGQVRGSKGLFPGAGGKWYYEVVIPLCGLRRGGKMVCGWGTLQHESLHSLNHVGSDMHSWGYNCVDRIFLLKSFQLTPPPNRPPMGGDVIGALLDFDAMMMAWSINGETLMWVSIPYQGGDEEVYPYVSSSVRGVRIRLIHTQCLPQGYHDFTLPNEQIASYSKCSEVKPQSYSFYKELSQFTDEASVYHFHLSSSAQSLLNSRRVHELLPRYPAVMKLVRHLNSMKKKCGEGIKLASTISAIASLAGSCTGDEPPLCIHENEKLLQGNLQDQGSLNEREGKDCTSNSAPFPQPDEYPLDVTVLTPYIEHLSGISDLTIIVSRGMEIIRDSPVFQHYYALARSLLLQRGRWTLFSITSDKQPDYTSGSATVKIDLRIAKMALEGTYFPASYPSPSDDVSQDTSDSSTNTTTRSSTSSTRIEDGESLSSSRDTSASESHTTETLLLDDDEGFSSSPTLEEALAINISNREIFSSSISSAVYIPVSSLIPISTELGFNRYLQEGHGSSQGFTQRFSRPNFAPSETDLKEKSHPLLRSKSLMTPTLKFLFYSVTGQLFHQTEKKDIYSKAAMFTVHLIGDLTVDGGGVRRSILSDISNELSFRVVNDERVDPVVPLFKLCRHSSMFTIVPNVERFIVSPEATEEQTSLFHRMLVWLGKIMGNITLCGTLKLPLPFPRLVWKFLSFQEPTIQDYFYDIDDSISHVLQDPDILQETDIQDLVHGVLVDPPSSSFPFSYSTNRAAEDEENNDSIFSTSFSPMLKMNTPTHMIPRHDLASLRGWTRKSEMVPTTSSTVMTGPSSLMEYRGSRGLTPLVSPLSQAQDKNQNKSVAFTTTPPSYTYLGPREEGQCSNDDVRDTGLGGDHTDDNTLASLANYKARVEFALLHQYDSALLSLQKGLTSVVPVSSLEAISWDDLQKRICGTTSLCSEEIFAFMDCSSLPPEILENLEQALDGMTDNERRNFLMFCSGQNCLPLPKKISVTCGDDPTRMPTAHTCFPLSLQLQPYKDAEAMREMLMLCVAHANQYGLV